MENKKYNITIKNNKHEDMTEQRVCSSDSVGMFVADYFQRNNIGALEYYELPIDIYGYETITKEKIVVEPFQTVFFPIIITKEDIDDIENYSDKNGE